MEVVDLGRSPEDFQDQRDLIQQQIDGWMLRLKNSFQSETWSPALQRLWDSMNYSFSGPGKRTRPVLGLLVSEQLGVDPRKMIPWVLAVEMVHTYSLIHDDLPCMDNDDFRRGKPTNHKVFDQSTALLAGDTLLTEAFGLVAEMDVPDTARVVAAVKLLSHCSGFQGMAGGQAVDLLSKGQKFSFEQTVQLQRMKTGALFEAVCQGVALLAGSSQASVQTWQQFGKSLGFAFQLADDILDSQEKLEPGSFPDLIGLTETTKLLDQQTEHCLGLLKSLNLEAGPLKSVVLWNRNRKK